MKIGAIIVTYNRLEFLKKTLEAYENAEETVDVLMIVNNGSTDGTKEFLDNWQKIQNGKIRKIVLNLMENTGGSGGFYHGLKKMLALDVDWVWLADDDAIPDKNAFKLLRRFINNLSNAELSGIAALCSSVYESEEKIFSVTRRRINTRGFIVREVPVSYKEYLKKSFEIDEFSYVGVAISAECLRKVGLPRQDFFIYYDDTEHSLRVRKCGKILCIPSVKVFHGNNFFNDVSVKQRNYYFKNTSSNKGVNWKYYYGVRNKLITYRIHFGTMPFLIEAFKILSKQIIASVLKPSTFEKRRAAISGVFDALREKTGKSEIYSP